jgi:6,7-dimethyl-8-ribityllumazine synthase
MIVESRFSPEVADELCRGAIEELQAAGASYKRYSVPHICQIPVAIRYAIRSIEIFPARKRFDGYIALGCHIMGNEDHHLSQCAQALQNLSIQFSLALGCGVIGAPSQEIAWSRASSENEGAQAAQTCLEMIKLKSEFKLFPRTP